MSFTSSTFPMLSMGFGLNTNVTSRIVCKHGHVSLLTTKLDIKAGHLEGKVQRSQRHCVQAKEKLMHIEVKHQRGEVQALAKELALQQRYAAKVQRKLETLQSKQPTMDVQNNPQV